MVREQRAAESFRISPQRFMLVHEGWALVTSSDLNYVPKTLPPNAITLGVRFYLSGFWRTQFSPYQFSARALRLLGICYVVHGATADYYNP